MIQEKEKIDNIVYILGLKNSFILDEVISQINKNKMIKSQDIRQLKSIGFPYSLAINKQMGRPMPAVDYTSIFYYIQIEAVLNYYEIVERPKNFFE